MPYPRGVARRWYDSTSPWVGSRAYLRRARRVITHQRRPAASGPLSTPSQPSHVYCVGWDLCQLEPWYPRWTLRLPTPRDAVGVVADDGARRGAIGGGRARST